MLALIRVGGDISWVADGATTINGPPISRTTRFRIGSITKPLVAALVLLEVENGRFALDDEVEDLLPGVLRPDPPITVRQLLDHTSGLFDEGNEGDPEADINAIADDELRAEAQALLARYRAGEDVVLTDRLWVALAETHDRYFDPGTDIHYGNVNYQVLGMILERQTATSVAELFETAFVAPLALEQSSLAPADRSTPDMHGYDTNREPGQLVDVTDDIAWLGNGAHGGVISTADELLEMLSAIVAGHVLSAELTDEMRTPSRSSYGLGLATYTLSCGSFFGHGGSILGTQSIALVDEQGADGVVVAINITSDRDPALPRLADQLLCPAGR